MRLPKCNFFAPDGAGVTTNSEFLALVFSHCLVLVELSQSLKKVEDEEDIVWDDYSPAFPTGSQAHHQRETAGGVGSKL